MAGSGLVPAPAPYWPHALPALLLGKDPAGVGRPPCLARRRDCWLGDLETCISIAWGKIPSSHSGFDLQASSPSCVARRAGHSPSSQPSAHPWLPRPHQPYLGPASLHDVSLGAGGRAFLIRPALLCPAGSPCWAHPGGGWGGPASKSPAQQGPGDTRAPSSPLPGSGASLPPGYPGDSAPGCCLYATRPMYNTKALLCPLLPWFPQQRQAAREQSAEGVPLGQRAWSPPGRLGNPRPPPKCSQLGEKSHRDSALQGLPEPPVP